MVSLSAAKEGTIDHLLRPLIYRLFANVVLYSEKYHGLQEVYMDDHLGEIAAKVTFQNVEDVGKFTFAPYWIDTIAHLAGFVLNGGINTPKDTVFNGVTVPPMKDISGDKFNGEIKDGYW